MFLMEQNYYLWKEQKFNQHFMEPICEKLLRKVPSQTLSHLCTRTVLEKSSPFWPYNIDEFLKKSSKSPCYSFPKPLLIQPLHINKTSTLGLQHFCSFSDSLTVRIVFFPWNVIITTNGPKFSPYDFSHSSFFQLVFCGLV